MRMTFSTPVTPTRDSDTWTVGSWDCTSGEEIVMARASGTEDPRVATPVWWLTGFDFCAMTPAVGWKPQCSAPSRRMSRPQFSVGDIAEERVVAERRPVHVED